jgi:hypothetical protein
MNIMQLYIVKKACNINNCLYLGLFFIAIFARENPLCAIEKITISSMLLIKKRFPLLSPHLNFPPLCATPTFFLYV